MPLLRLTFNAALELWTGWDSAKIKTYSMKNMSLWNQTCSSLNIRKAILTSYKSTHCTEEELQEWFSAQQVREVIKLPGKEKAFETLLLIFKAQWCKIKLWWVLNDVGFANSLQTLLEPSSAKYLAIAVLFANYQNSVMCVAQWNIKIPVEMFHAHRHPAV